jgi:aspartyl-tRNA(Asn)/glutamyl-tRNA(Gln) amidotransferase subunit A
MKPLHELSIAEAGALLRNRRITSIGLTEHALSRIDALDPVLHAFALVTRDRALDDAQRADSELQVGIYRGPMHGIPYALKDIYSTAGIRTTCYSKILKDSVPAQDCFIETRLKAGGAVLLGKVATHEFALGGPSFELPFPPARNPWNPDYFTGASSSGSAVAVAAGLARVAMGSDTSGSIRGPAFHCGTVGLKPTYGRVSRRGIFPLSYSLDHCGPLTWTVQDAALVMQVVAGFDPMDPGSADVPVPDFTAAIGQDLDQLKIGFPRHFFVDAGEVSREVIALIDDAAQKLSGLGAVVEEVRLPDYELFNACGRIIMTAEAYAIHESDLKTRALDFGRYTYQRLIPGATLSAADLVQAFRLRRELATILNGETLKIYDALICASGLAPAARFTDFPLDWPPPKTAVAMQTIAFNVTGNPALSIPIGFSEGGLPLGMQIVGRAFDEPMLFRIGAAYEATTDLSATRPPDFGGLGRTQ